MTNELLQDIADSQMVLVGIGKEMEENYQGMNEDTFYGPLLAQAEEEKDRAAIIQYLRCHYVRRHPNPRIKKAYEKLTALLDGKNYFILSLSEDDYIFNSGLDRERIVTPCGGFRKLQCTERCNAEQESLVTDDKVILQVLEEIDNCNGDLSSVDFPVCTDCCGILWFNRIETPGYREEGYLTQWEKYTKWLQGTLNHKLCILELGAGMEYPSVIRFPFEKVAFFNQKSVFYRVHGKLPYLTEELSERGISAKTDAITFLSEEGNQG